MEKFKYCDKCGAKNRDGARFCNNCGSSLEYKKHNKKIPIIISILFLLLILVLGGGFFYVENNKKVEQNEAKNEKIKANTNSKKSDDNSEKQSDEDSDKQKGNDEASQGNSTNETIPSSYQGNWYQGTTLSYIISGNSLKFVGNAGLTEVKPNDSNWKFDIGSNFIKYSKLNEQAAAADGGSPDTVWSGTVTVSGEKQRAIAHFTRPYYVMIATEKPTAKSLGTMIRVGNANDFVGESDFDNLLSKGVQTND